MIKADLNRLGAAVPSDDSTDRGRCDAPSGAAAVFPSAKASLRLGGIFVDSSSIDSVPSFLTGKDTHRKARRKKFGETAVSGNDTNLFL